MVRRSVLLAGIAVMGLLGAACDDDSTDAAVRRPGGRH